MFRRHKIRGESHVRQRQVGGLEPTVEREHVCGPDVISTATVKGAREISAGRSPLAQQVARAVRARRNHVGGVPANCGSVSPERSEPRSGRYAYQEIRIIRKVGFALSGRRRGCTRPNPVNIG